MGVPRRLGRNSAGAGGRAERPQDVFESDGQQLVRRLAGGLAAQPAPGRGPVEAGPTLQRVAQSDRVVGGDVGVEGREQYDGAASEVGDNTAHLGVGYVITGRDRPEIDPAV